MGDLETLDRSADFFGQDFKILAGGHREDDGEFLAAVTGRKVRRTLAAVHDGARDALQDLIAGEVAKGVVVQRELIDIGHDQRKRRPGAERARQRAIRSVDLHEARPAFERIARTAQRLTGAPMAHVCIVGPRSLWIAGVDASVSMMTKGGLNTITRSLAIEYAKAGIRFNAVAPGVVNTPLHSDDPQDHLRTLQPMGSLAEVKDIVEAVLYLSRARQVTGQVLYVDGGAHVGRW